MLAELSLLGRIDTDMESLILLDRSETGDPFEDQALRQIAEEEQQRDARYWVERLAPLAEDVIAATLDRLVERGIREHHPGEFWTLGKVYREAAHAPSELGAADSEFVKARVSRILYAGEIPDPRDVIVIALVNACNVFRYMEFQLDEETERRIEQICRMDLIGHAIGEAVSESIAAPILRRAPLTSPIPTVSLRDLALNPHLRAGRLPALFASMAEKYGPVYEMRPPFKEPLIILAGLAANQWAHRLGRLYLRSQDYFQVVNEVYGSARSVHSMDGADHFRYRKALQPVYARETLTDRLDETFDNARLHMSQWRAGDVMPVQRMLRPLLNAQVSPLLTSTETQDIIDDVLKYKMRVLNVGLAKILPRFMLRTPTTRRRARRVEELNNRILVTHTPAQRKGLPRDVVDGYLNLHASDPQLLPETDLGVPLGTALMASMYLGAQLGFALYALVQHPELYQWVRDEADALFSDGDPAEADFSLDQIDVSHRVLMESLRMTPIVPMAMRTVMNTCVVEGHELPVGASVYIANTAAHYMAELFPDPWRFDIDRYAPPRNEHLGEGFSPYGLGTHSCLGFRWAELHLVINLLMLAHHCDIEFARPYNELPMDTFPSQSPSNRLKFRIAARRRPMPA